MTTALDIYFSAFQIWHFDMFIFPEATLLHYF